ncbi:MAG: biotin transporter BioY [Lachnospiraceae bacterium]|nr:biotin transporter BioY [Lachnospiraceae bacterium]
MGKTKFKTIDIAYIGLMVAVMAVCSWITVPYFAVPFTLQTFAVFVTIGLLGMERGLIAVLVYIILGLIGVPVFAGFKGGASVLMGTTGGYIIGFIFSALVTGLILKKSRKVWVMALAMVLGLIVCYAFGTAWFMVVYAKTKASVGLWTALTWCVIPFIIPDLCKIAVAVVISKRVGKYLNTEVVA